MSDFLGRIAARAVGAQALAQPRLAARLLGAGNELDVVDEEVVAPAAAPRPLERAPAAPAGPAPAPRTVTPPPDVFARTTLPVPPTAALEAEAEELARFERPLPAPELAPLPPAESGADTPDAEPRVVVRAVTVPVTPALPIVAPQAAAAVAVMSGRRDEPPPVRVHIGRLEVRANLQEQPRPAPRPEPSERGELSLADYLRGRRGA